MNIKKIVIYLISVLSFIGLGITLSLQQSQRADQVLNNNGLSAKYYVYTVKDKLKVKDLLNFLNKKIDNNHLQVHLKSKYDQNRILIWANYNIPSQPLAKSSSRYFTKSDFDNQIPLAVISAQTKDGVMLFQGHHYLKENNRYITVIGQLKGNSESENSQKVYYLTTGVKQPTANEALNDYQVSIDGLNNNQASQVKKYLGGSQKIVDFASTYNRQHGINPTKKFLFAIICIIVILITSAVMGILDSKKATVPFSKKSLINYLLGSSVFKYVLLSLLTVVVIFGGMQLTNFYSDKMQLFNLYGILWALEILTYGTMLFFKRGKEKK